MIKVLLRFAAVLATLSPAMSIAEPLKLKLSFFTSDRTIAYQAAIKPFVEAVNREGNGVVQIEVYLSGTLGKVQRELPQLVLDGIADIAFIVPGQNPELFPDNGVVELPGLFRDAREASLVYTRLVAQGALAGYERFFVIGAYGTDPETIHSRKPIARIADLKGQRIRTNNLTEAAALAKLGVLPIVLAFNETTPAISAGMIDGATVPVAQLFDVGIGRLTNHHYLLPTSAAPLTLMMSRERFEQLPTTVQSLIRKYSGEWTAQQFANIYRQFDREVMDHIKADPRRHVVTPSADDRKAADAAFASVRRQWTAASARNAMLLDRVVGELATLRGNK